MKTLPLTIKQKIYSIRGKQVMLDSDLAELYEVETKALKQQVRRNPDRFPTDFMFELTIEELQNLRSQKVTSSWGGNRYRPMAFTEHGILMLSSVLRSPRAVEMNILIMRVFLHMRELLQDRHDILKKLEEIEKRVSTNDHKLHALIAALRNLTAKPVKERNLIGFDRVPESVPK